MGGTSTDVFVANAATGAERTRESVVAGVPIGVPMLDIHTAGAGGGSIARFDAGGMLHVGPESAGADPGPICFGRGERATVTDANFLLGRLDAASFLGGGVHLDGERTRRMMGEQMGALATVEEFRGGNRARGRDADGKSHSRHQRGARARSARLYAGGVWRRRAPPRLLAGPSAAHSARAGSGAAGRAFGGGNSAGGYGAGFFADGDAAGRSDEEY